MAKRVTIAHVAREAGVSNQTVSRAINNKNEIGSETKARILEIARQMGYRPSNIARSLARQRTTTIGLVVPDIANPFFSEIARGVDDIAYANSYNVFLCTTYENIEKEQVVLDSLWRQQIDGLILCSSRLDEGELTKRVREFNHVILVNRELSETINGLGIITVDDVIAAKKAVDNFISRGRDRIAFVAGPRTSHSGRDRLTGYKEGLKEHGIDMDPKLIVHCEPSINGGYVSSLKLLAKRNDISAIYAYNDIVAIGVLQACKELGRKIPEDVAIIGSDDIPLASLVTPKLSTMRINMQQIGISAMEALINCINGDNACAKHVFSPEFVLRDSTP